MLRLDTFIVAEFVSMLNFFYEKCWDTGLVTPTFIIEPFLNFAASRLPCRCQMQTACISPAAYFITILWDVSSS